MAKLPPWLRKREHKQSKWRSQEQDKAQRLVVENKLIMEMLDSGSVRESARARLWAVVKRDGRQCWICKELLDMELIGLELPMSPTLDHLVPLSKGGSKKKLSNLMAAHSKCNRKRGNEDPPPEVLAELKKRLRENVAKQEKAKRPRKKKGPRNSPTVRGGELSGAGRGSAPPAGAVAPAKQGNRGRT